MTEGDLVRALWSEENSWRFKPSRMLYNALRVRECFLCEQFLPCVVLVGEAFCAPCLEEAAGYARRG